MDRLPIGGLTVYKTTRVGLVLRVFFNDLAVKNRKEDVACCKTIRSCLFIGVVRDPNMIRPDCFDDVGYLHAALP